MKIIVTHTSPDWDAIGSVWLLRRYLPGWHDASVKFVPAGQRLEGSTLTSEAGVGDPVEKVGKDEVIHVDTGLGPLDHHQIKDTSISGAGLAWRYILRLIDEQKIPITETEKWEDRKEAISRVVQFIVDTDHFKEVFWVDPVADYHEFTVLGLLDGLKLLKPDQDDYYVEFGFTCLEAMLHTFENRIWAEREIKENGQEFETRWGKALAFDTINDSVLKLAQKMGYNLVVRKDPRKGYVRIKARPSNEISNLKSQISNDQLEKRNGKAGVIANLRPKVFEKQSLRDEDIDLTLAYEKLRKIDPHATWFLHASKKMLLNGTPKNPKMIATKLTLEQIIEVLKTI
ncbi:MAG: DHH family phosphoesterase [Candidatus Levybacteria bacterium]|nr:DHH family phosphoesterase [Candidatus Levybacteria bacterium]